MRQGPVIIETTEWDYYDIDTTFKSDEENFRFAFGIMTSFENPDSSQEEDQSLFGSIKARSLSWGHEGQGPGYKETDLKSSPCTPQQLGLVEEENENTLFYAPHSRSKSTLE